MSYLKAEEGFKVVTLVMEVCCGCACDDVNLERIVPLDSPLNNGDRIPRESSVKGDYIIED